MSEMMVSICVLSYNHEKYLRDSLEGIVKQKTTFPIEAWVHDDASTDSSPLIIKEYQNRYPDIIKPILQTENQYSKKDGSIIAKFVYPRCTGKYIALCEGDDYWTDPYKLQKQVDFMEAHPECTVTFHRYDILRQEEQTWRTDACDVYMQPNQSEVLLTIPMYFKHWVTQPCTMMYRNGISLGVEKSYKFYKDQHMIFHMLNEGDGYILNFKGAVYREHKGGIHSKTHVLSQSRLAVDVADELYKYNKNVEGTKDNLIRTLDWAINCETRCEGGDESLMLTYIWKRFWLSKSLKTVVKQLLR